MVVTTRSKAKKAEKLGVSKSKSESGEIKKKTWRDWLTNRVVMEKAREYWMREIFEPRLRTEDPALIATHRFLSIARREWASLPENDKAPFIPKALDSFVTLAHYCARRGKKVVTKNKQTKQEKMTESREAFNSFLRDYFDKHYMTYPDYNLTKEFRRAPNRAWSLLAESDKAKYIAEVKKKNIDRDELYKYLQNVEPYKDMGYL